MIENLVVGCGISGAVMARLLADDDKQVTIIDSKNHIGGLCYDERDSNGIMIQKYGSHIFHTNSKKVYEFLLRFTAFNNYKHEVVANVNAKELSIPFNLISLYEAFDQTTASKFKQKLLSKFTFGSKVSIVDLLKENDPDLQNLGQFIYDHIFKNYTLKQWGKNLNELDPAVAARVPVKISDDRSYFEDQYQGIPAEGFTKLFENLLNHPNIQVHLNTKFEDFKEPYQRLFYSGAIDEFFNYEYGRLEYRSVRFEFEKHDKPYFQSHAVVNYPNEEKLTRIHEFKYYLNDISNQTVISKEYPEAFSEGKNERCYPLTDDQNQKLYAKYLEKASKLKNIYFFGRLADYRYYNIDQAVLRALGLFETLKIKD